MCVFYAYKIFEPITIVISLICTRDFCECSQNSRRVPCFPGFAACFQCFCRLWCGCQPPFQDSSECSRNLRWLNDVYAVSLNSKYYGYFIYCFWGRGCLSQGDVGAKRKFKVKRESLLQIRLGGLLPSQCAGLNPLSMHDIRW